MAAKIVIEVNGGVVQEVYFNDPNVAVVIVDWDTGGCEPEEDTYVVEDDLGNEHRVRAVEVPTTPMNLLPRETRAAVDAAS
jgi:hypothetical protein